MNITVRGSLESYVKAKAIEAGQRPGDWVRELVRKQQWMEQTGAEPRHRDELLTEHDDLGQSFLVQRGPQACMTHPGQGVHIVEVGEHMWLRRRNGERQYLCMDCVKAGR